ncbi:unannotated protein [freshwater metagenome]|uniref:Unannotated protein n=1 Tax=freshwater metagenome TaxID=449393 RepID=A0A6J7MHC1_9ZZZZ
MVVSYGARRSRARTDDVAIHNPPLSQPDRLPDHASAVRTNARRTGDHAIEIRVG